MNVQWKVWAARWEWLGRQETHCPRASSFVLMGVKLSLLGDSCLSFVTQTAIVVVAGSLSRAFV